MITAKGIKPVAPFLHRFDNLYLFGAFSPITGDSCLLEMPHCNSQTFQVFIDQMANQSPKNLKYSFLTTVLSIMLKPWIYPEIWRLFFYPHIALN
ncbi:MAG: hypothetical protein WDO19_01080 [Bacteroidota bacterium]